MKGIISSQPRAIVLYWAEQEINLFDTENTDSFDTTEIIQQELLERFSS